MDPFAVFISEEKVEGKGEQKQIQRICNAFGTNIVANPQWRKISENEDCYHGEVGDKCHFKQIPTVGSKNMDGKKTE